jgi:hypothetical protein
MAFFVMTPEDAGHAEAQDSAGTPLYVFDTWLGDDLVRTHPVFLATTRLKNTLETLPGPTGFQSARIRAERSPFLRHQRPQLRLPTFWVLEINGEAGRHPLGLASDLSLVVSQAALDCLVQHTIVHAQFSHFVPAGQAQRTTDLEAPGAEPRAVGRADEG